MGNNFSYFQKTAGAPHTRQAKVEGKIWSAGVVAQL
jgi:hypothetical protein